jgi:Predicted AAA-ATPase/PD-(D/E)XK nuclease superfamily
MIRIPYGESDFKSLILQKKFYQDRTNFIPILEKWNAQFPVFLRPRRFGKSLFVSMLHHYYGLEHKENFKALFGNLFIGKNPTELANSYLVLRFEFSRIDTATQESTYKGFYTNVNLGIRDFLANYIQFFSEDDQSLILAQSSPEDLVKTLFSVIKTNKVPYTIYLLIDEYDHFANELLSFDLTRFKSNVSGNGFVRKFYESFKTASGEGVIERIFITGVSPITLDSLTSGFNIASNITLNPIFNEMMGFTEEEVRNLLVLSDIPTEKIPIMLDDLRDWYDGYCFSEKAKNHLFNPDMVLYFLKEYGIMNTYPRKMLDTNVVSDYSKIANLFKIGGDEMGRLGLLNELVKDGYVDFSLTEIYNLESPFTQYDFLSLLFYMGMLTLREGRQVGWRFEVPNYVIKKLYFEYFTSIYVSKTRFSKEIKPIGDAVTLLVSEAKPDSFFKIVEEVLKQNHSNRDEMSYGEKHLQTLMIGLLFPFESYMIHSEYEAKRTYPDIFLERIPDKFISYEIVFEIKYATKNKANTLPAKILEAQNQLNGYMSTERFARPNVRGFYVVFCGGDLYEWKEYGKY